MKRLILVFVIVFICIFAFGVFAASGIEPIDQTTVEESSVKDVKPASQVERLILEHTPPFIKKSMETTAEILEEIRLSAHYAMKDKVVVLNTKIEAIDQEETQDPVDVLEAGGTPIKHSPLERAVLVVRLFFLKLVDGIFASRLAFYGVSLFVIIAILRYIFN